MSEENDYVEMTQRLLREDPRAQSSVWNVYKLLKWTKKETYPDSCDTAYIQKEITAVRKALGFFMRGAM